MESARDSLGLQRISPQKIRDLEMQLPRRGVYVKLEPTEVKEERLWCKITLKTAIKASRTTKEGEAWLELRAKELTLTGTTSFKEVE